MAIRFVSENVYSVIQPELACVYGIARCSNVLFNFREDGDLGFDNGIDNGTYIDYAEICDIIAAYEEYMSAKNQIFIKLKGGE